MVNHATDTLQADRAGLLWVMRLIRHEVVLTADLMIEDIIHTGQDVVSKPIDLVLTNISLWSGGEDKVKETCACVSSLAAEDDELAAALEAAAHPGEMKPKDAMKLAACFDPAALPALPAQ